MKIFKIMPDWLRWWQDDMARWPDCHIVMQAALISQAEKNMTNIPMMQSL